jgi:hypothetical protein
VSPVIHQAVELVGWAALVCILITLVSLSFVHRNDESKVPYDTEFPEAPIKHRAQGDRLADLDGRGR